MFWLSILGIFLGVIWITYVLKNCNCSDANCLLEFSVEETPQIVSLAEPMEKCQRVLHELELQKEQLNYRLQMLDEMIEASDQEILRFENQISRMEQIQSHPFSKTDLEMLRLLRAGGYESSEIARLTCREPDELDRAA